MKKNLSKLIILYDYFSPAYKAGGPVQSLANLAKTLGGELPVKVICRNVDHDNTPLNVPYDKWIDVQFGSVYYNSNGFSAIKKNVSEGSVVFINGMYSPLYNFLPALWLEGRKIVAVRGMLHPDGLFQKAWKKKIYLTVWKLLKLHRRCEFHATSEQEKQFILDIFGKKTKVWVVQNLPNCLEYSTCPSKSSGSLRMATIALISPMKNHLEVIKALSGMKEDVVYDIYGPVKDKAYWEKCKTAIGKLPTNIKVSFHGDVCPGEIEAILDNIHVYIQPSKSENFGHSLYEAMSKGRPVITSHNTPWNNLHELKAGCNVTAANEAELQQAIRFFANMDSDQLAAWSKGAREYAGKAIDVVEIKKQYIEMFSVTPGEEE